MVCQSALYNQVSGGLLSATESRDKPIDLMLFSKGANKHKGIRPLGITPKDCSLAIA